MHLFARQYTSSQNDKALAKINELRSKLLPHPPYSPDLAPSGFYLSPNLKRWLQVQRFLSNEELKWKIDDYFGGLGKSYYKRHQNVERSLH